MHRVVGTAHRRLRLRLAVVAMFGALVALVAMVIPVAAGAMSSGSGSSGSWGSPKYGCHCETTTTYAATTTTVAAITTIANTTTTPNHTLPFTGGNVFFPLIFGVCCLASGVLLVLRRPGSWRASS